MLKLSGAELKKQLKNAAGWQFDNDVISKNFKFVDFAQALDFMNQLAVIADKELNHHPDWSNSFNVVSISLTTHDAGGLTMKDIKLAAAADKIAKSITS